MTVQELVDAARQLSVSEQILLAEEIKRIAEQTLHSSDESELEASPLPEEEDPLVGLFSGSPNLATDAKKVLSQAVTSTSGFTCKEP